MRRRCCVGVLQSTLAAAALRHVQSSSHHCRSCIWLHIYSVPFLILPSAGNGSARDRISRTYFHIRYCAADTLQKHQQPTVTTNSIRNQERVCQICCFGISQAHNPLPAASASSWLLGCFAEFRCGKGDILLSVFQKRRLGARPRPLSKYNSSVTGYSI